MDVYVEDVSWRKGGMYVHREQGAGERGQKGRMDEGDESGV